MPRTKSKKEPKLTRTWAQGEAARLGLEVDPQYDKRYTVTWLYTIGHDVEPVKRKAMVHVPKKKERKPVSMAELIQIANGAK